MQNERLDHDRQYQSTGVIGIDEAGRGPLAGPVVAAAVYLSPAFLAQAEKRENLEQFNDSKKLSALRRRRLLDVLDVWKCDGDLAFEYAVGSVSDIAEFNILGATRKAMAEATIILQTKFPETPILIDGPAHEDFPFEHRGIVKGDSLSLSIAMASIVAKVMRDKIMSLLDAEYPMYGFAKHKGYGTQMHRSAILQHGRCPEHRDKFLRSLSKRAPE